MMDDVQFQKSNFAIMLEFPEKNDVFKNGISDALSHDDSSVQIPAANKSYTKAFECKKCVKVLSSKSSLLRHLRQVHHGVRPFQCEECLKSFTQKNNLIRHQRFHSKQSSKNDKVGLNINTSTQENYHCLKSEKDIINPQSLKRHQKVTHQDQKLHKCVVCQKQFTLKTDLLDHLWLHNEEKPFACDRCAIRFIKIENMMNHKKLHMNSFIEY